MATSEGTPCVYCNTMIPGLEAHDDAFCCERCRVQLRADPMFPEGAPLAAVCSPLHRVGGQKEDVYDQYIGLHIVRRLSRDRSWLYYKDVLPFIEEDTLMAGSFGGVWEPIRSPSDMDDASDLIQIWMQRVITPGRGAFIEVRRQIGRPPWDLVPMVKAFASGVTFDDMRASWNGYELGFRDKRPSVGRSEYSFTGFDSINQWRPRAEAIRSWRRQALSWSRISTKYQEVYGDTADPRTLEKWVEKLEKLEQSERNSA